MKRSFATGAACLTLVFAIVLSFGADTAEAQLFSRLRCKMAAKKACAPAKTCCETPAPTCCDPCKKPGLLARMFSKKNNCAGCEATPAPAAMDEKIVPPAPEATKEAPKPTT